MTLCYCGFCFFILLYSCLVKALINSVQPYKVAESILTF